MHEYESSKHLKINWAGVAFMVATIALGVLTIMNAKLNGTTDGYTLVGALFTACFVIFTAAARTNVRDRVAQRRSQSGLPFIGE